MLDKLHLSAKLKTTRTLDCDWSHGQHVHYYLRLIRQKLSLRPARSKENKLKLPHYIALLNFMSSIVTKLRNKTLTSETPPALTLTLDMDVFVV